MAVRPRREGRCRRVRIIDGRDTSGSLRWPGKISSCGQNAEPSASTAPTRPTAGLYALANRSLVLAVVQDRRWGEPGAAETWEANGDLTQWTFHLRRGVTFSNGATFDANDVVASYSAIWDAKARSQRQWACANTGRSVRRVHVRRRNNSSGQSQINRATGRWGVRCPASRCVCLMTQFFIRRLARRPHFWGYCSLLSSGAPDPRRPVWWRWASAPRKNSATLPRTLRPERQHRCAIRPLLHQHVARGLWHSLRTGRAVSDVLLERLPMTIELRRGMLFSTTFGVILDHLVGAAQFGGGCGDDDRREHRRIHAGVLAGLAVGLRLCLLKDAVLFPLRAD